jgi:hypothetical protein
MILLAALLCNYGRGFCLIDVGTEGLSQAGGPYAWFFLLLNRTFVSLLDVPDMFYGVSESTPSPVLREVSLHALEGLAGIERDDPRAVMASANFLRYP